MEKIILENQNIWIIILIIYTVYNLHKKKKFHIMKNGFA